MATRISFDFDDDSIADEFMDAVSNWLGEFIPAPTLALLQQRIRKLGPYSTYIPRHWIYEDVSPFSERLTQAREG